MKRKQYHKIEVREVFQFLALTLSSILILFIIGEVVLLAYWNYNSKFIKAKNVAEKELPSLISIESESIISRDEIVLNYQKDAVKIIDQILLSEELDPTVYQNIRSKILAMRVPGEYQNFHLRLVLLLDQNISEFKDAGEKYSRETTKILLKQKQELNNFVASQRKIIAQNYE